jgi:hypothetical protein
MWSLDTRIRKKQILPTLCQKWIVVERGKEVKIIKKTLFCDTPFGEAFA